MEVQTFNNVFDPLADTQAEAANLKARSELLSGLCELGTCRRRLRLTV